jgi:hypothetical protein
MKLTSNKNLLTILLVSTVLGPVLFFTFYSFLFGSWFGNAPPAFFSCKEDVSGSVTTARQRLEQEGLDPRSCFLGSYEASEGIEFHFIVEIKRSKMNYIVIVDPAKGTVIRSGSYR